MQLGDLLFLFVISQQMNFEPSESNREELIMMSPPLAWSASAVRGLHFLLFNNTY